MSALMTSRWLCGFLGVLCHVTLADSVADTRSAPAADEQQLPRAMHSKMSEKPHVTVGRAEADIVGADNRALQAAVDYIASLGGGMVEIGEGEFVMRDSLHLRSHVTVRGKRPGTVLRKAAGADSRLELDGDYGEEQITLALPEGFDVGCGVAIWDDNAEGFHVTVARITGRNGRTVSLDRPLGSDYMVRDNARAATVFPVISAQNTEDAAIEGLTVEGSRDQNAVLGGCRGAAIYLYRAFGTVIRGCIARHFNGDGISFQASNDVLVENCISEQNAGRGLHPGSGSQRAVIRGCIARENGEDGLYLCWRVRHGLFENNRLENNGRHGISIGHKDSDNLLRENTVRENARDGVYFRAENLGMAPYRNRIEKNIVENNGRENTVAGIRVRGEVLGLVFIDNTIRDTRPAGLRKQKTGILIEKEVREITLKDNRIDCETELVDQRSRQ